MFAVASTFTTTDPYDANDTLSQAMAKSFYEGLFGFDKDMKLIPVLAESYDVSKDGLVYTIKLRKGVKFHDGTDFKADAVKVNLDRVTNPDNKLKRYGLYNNNIAKTEVVDDYTARITLKTPFSPFINQLAHPSTVMISPTALKQWGNKDIAFHPVGTGPFKFVEWKSTDYLKVAKFDGYWKKGYPKVDSITWKPVVDNNTRASVMQTGEAQFTFPVPYEMAEVLKAKPDLELVAAPSIVLRYLSMNVQHKPFDNPKVRQAIAYAINKEALAKVAFAGYASPAEGVVPQGVEYAVNLGAWPYDVAKAKQLLTEAGYPNGFETELWSAYNHTTASKVTQFLQQQLQQIGIKTRITLLEAGQRVEKVESWQDPATAPVRLYYVGWSTSTGEADWALRPLLDGELVAAAALQHGLLQEPAGRRGHQGCAAHHRQRGEGEALQGRAGDDLEGRALGPARRREAPVGEQQEAHGRLRDPRRVVQLHRHRPEVAACPSPRTRGLTNDRFSPRGAECCSSSPSACWGSCRRSSSSASLVFLFVHLLPGDPARLAAGPDATPETVELVRKDLGLDRPLPEQFARFAAGVVHWDFGKSLRTKRLVRDEIADRFMPTFWLTVWSMAWSVLFGMTIGILSAVWRNRWPDRAGMTLAVTGISFPSFALGMVLDAGLRGGARLAADGRRRHVAQLRAAVADPRRGGRGDHGALHPLVVRRHPRRGFHPHRRARRDWPRPGSS